VNVGGVQIGGGAPVVVQTMTKTETANLQATMDQIRRVAEAGADIVRCARIAALLSASEGRALDMELLRHCAAERAAMRERPKD